MPFYQNVIDQEVRDHLSAAGLKAALTFSIPASTNRSDYMQSGNLSPYNLSGNTDLTINYAFDPQLKAYSALTINVSGATAAATTAAEVVAALNANTIFAEYFTAEVRKIVKGNFDSGDAVLIKGKRAKISFRSYISNSSAESIIRFNKYATVAELPSIFDRHTIANRFNYPDSISQLIKLDTSDSVDQAVITAAGLDYTSPKDDWQFLAGRNTAYLFKKMTIDGSNRIEQVIEYPAGAKAGDLARKINYTYSGANTSPSESTEIPYILVSGDLITPP